MATWGAVNRAMHALIAGRVIASYTTDIGDRNKQEPVEVSVVPAAGQADDEVLGAVLRALARLGLGARVSVSRDVG